MRYRHSYLMALLLTLVLAACGGQTAGDVSGTWNGTVTESGVPFTLELTQNSTSLNGTLMLNNTPIPMTGTVAGNLISLSYQEAAGAIQIESSVNGNTMQGTLSVIEAGGQPQSVTFTASR